MNSSNPTVARSHSPPPPVSARIAPAYEKYISRTVSLVTMRFPGGRVETQRLGVGDVPHAPPLSHRTPPPSVSRHGISDCSSQRRLSPAISHQPPRRSITLHTAELPHQPQPQLPGSLTLSSSLSRPNSRSLNGKSSSRQCFLSRKTIRIRRGSEKGRTVERRTMSKAMSPDLNNAAMPLKRPSSATLQKQIGTSDPTTPEKVAQMVP